MSDIELVIKIPESRYRLLQKQARTNSGREKIDEFAEAVLNGTPLPKGHGKIGDLDAVMGDISTSIEEMSNIDIAVDGEYLWAKLNDAIYNAPTIIEADTESEDKGMKTNTHIVIKRKDIFQYLTDNQIKDLDFILNIIADGRKKDGKKAVNSYYICNIDEPYADEVLEVILKAENEDRK